MRRWAYDMLVPAYEAVADDLVLRDERRREWAGHVRQGAGRGRDRPIGSDDHGARQVEGPAQPGQGGLDAGVGVLGRERGLAERDLPRLVGVLSKSPGPCGVRFRVCTDSGDEVVLDAGVSIAPTGDFMEELEEVLRDNPITFDYPREARLPLKGNGNGGGNGRGHPPLRREARFAAERPHA